jgi:MFS family permease
MKFNLKSTTFRSFRNRNYVLYFIGQGTSQIGTWMQRTGVAWLIYTITHSNFMLGLTVFVSQFPSFLFSLYGGIISDRYNRYNILLVTQIAAMLQAILLAILTLTHHYAVWEILSLSAILGVINAFDVPARQPLVHDMIKDKADIPNALGFNSSLNNFARLVGPALSGLVMLKFGAGICFLLNALSFVAVIFCLVKMNLPAYIPSAAKKNIGSELVEGFVYLKNTSSIAIILILLSLVSLLVLPYNTLLPVFAKIIFKGNAATFGFINSFIGIGAVCGTFFLASLKPGTDLKIVLLVNTIIFGIALILFSQIGYFPLAMLFAILCGFGTMSQTAICNTLLQVNADKNMRGRVISYFAMAVFGMLPLGSLLVGALSQQIGAPDTLLIQGFLTLVIAATFSNFLRQDKLNRKETERLKEEEALLIERI